MPSGPVIVTTPGPADTALQRAARASERPKKSLRGPGRLTRAGPFVGGDLGATGIGALQRCSPAHTARRVWMSGRRIDRSGCSAPMIAAAMRPGRLGRSAWGAAKRPPHVWL